MSSYAPYNFIPFSEKKTPVPYGSRSELPGFDKVTDTRMSGRIDYEVHNLTPISVGGERPTSDKKSKNIPDGTFCTDGSGCFILPGSTMRGFFSSHVEILSASYPELIGDNRYLYRTFADKSKKVRKEYTKKLKAETHEEYRLPGVQAGFIYKEREYGEDVFYMAPARQFGEYGTTFFRVHEADLRRANVFEDENHYMYSRKIPKYRGDGGRDSLKKYKKGLEAIRNEHYKAYRGVRVTFDYTDRICNIGTGSMEGLLLNSGGIEGKTHHYIVSAERTEEAFVMDRRDVLLYENDYRRNCIQNKVIEKNKAFYGLPEGYGFENSKLFFYKKDDRTGQLTGFGPTPYFRIFYNYDVKSGLPEEVKTGFDYVRSLFGYERGSEAYKSRLSFTNCRIQDPSVQARQVKLYAGSPKGTAFQLYLDQTGKDVSGLNTYNDRHFELRGRKFYWKRSAPVGRRMGDIEPNTSIAVIPAENVFTGSIYFDNLSEEELGLVLCALQVKDETETYQIGNGKVYGYGKVAIRGIRVRTYDPSQRFCSINVEEKDVTARISGYRDCYKRTLKDRYGIDFDEDESIRTYIALANMNDADAYLNGHQEIYLPLNKYRDREPLPTAGEIIKNLAGVEKHSASNPIAAAGGKKSASAGNSANDSSGGGGKMPVSGQGKCLWAAKYKLPKQQQEKLKQMLPEGTWIDQQQEWLRKGDLPVYAAQYQLLALPSSTYDWLIAEAKKYFQEVYVAVKVDGKDGDWRKA